LRKKESGVTGVPTLVAPLSFWWFMVALFVRSLLVMQKFAARFLFLFALALWFGGYIFFGAVAAPAMFQTARLNDVYEIAPKMVGLILSRFAILATIAGVLMLVGWLVEGISSRANRSWKLQGGFTIAALFLSLISNFVLLPKTLVDQQTVLPIATKFERKQPLTPEETQIKADFDKSHKTSERIGGLILLCLLVSLGAFVANINRESFSSKSALGG